MLTSFELYNTAIEINMRTLGHIPNFRQNKGTHKKMSALTSNYLSSQVVSNQVLSAYKGLTAVFDMGTGGTP